MSTRLNGHLLNAPLLKGTVLVWVTCCLTWLLTGCGGIGTAAAQPSLNPVLSLAPAPSVASISPSTATRGGAALSLTVDGANFLPTSTVEWNGNAQATSFVSPTELIAQLTADDIAVAQTYKVTVVNPSPGGGTSAFLPFNVPCVIAPPTVASNQAATRLGAYYFDGWAGPMTSYHLQPLVNSAYQDRQPLSGWRDDNPCAVEQQLAWARSFGLDFFVYLWYHNAKALSPTENLNSALEITHSLSNRHGMQFAIMYTDHDPFTVTPADWAATTNEWISYMTDPGYMRVNGKPLLILYDMGAMRQAFGSSSAVASAFDQLRAAAQAQGLPGVYIVGGFFAGINLSTQAGVFPDLSSAVTEGYDAVTMYNWWMGGLSGEQPFSTLSGVGQWVWSQAALSSPLPFVPVVMDGWDPRAWNAQATYWFSRTPQDVAGLVNSAVAWADSNPQLRPESSPAPPIVLIEAWNELGEGGYIVPTVGNGTSYGDSLAAMLAMH